MDAHIQASSSASAAASSSSASTSPRFIDEGHIELVDVIGTGAYGVVYLGIDSRHGIPTYRAIKCLRRHGLDSRQRHFQRREIALHRLASAHPSIVTMDRIIEEGDHTYVVMDYGEEGDLFAMITDRQRYVGDDELIRHVFTQLIDGISYLHSLGIAHRDIKPENIVCSEGGERVKICDFGLATSEVTSSEFGCGSTFYIAPECLGDWFADAQAYPTQPGDVWSLGVILVNLACGRNPWRIASPSDESFNAFLADPVFLRRILPVSKQCLYILTRIFTVNPADRITLPELRSLIAHVGSFTMNEEELRYAHAAALKGDLALIPDAVADEDGDMRDYVDHGLYEDEVVYDDDEEAVFSYDPDTETPSLRADSGSPSPPADRSRTASSCGGSLPPTPLLGAEDPSKVGGPAAIWELFKKPQSHFLNSPDILSSAAVSPSPFFR